MFMLVTVQLKANQPPGNVKDILTFMNTVLTSLMLTFGPWNLCFEFLSSLVFRILLFSGTVRAGLPLVP